LGQESTVIQGHDVHLTYKETVSVPKDLKEVCIRHEDFDINKIKFKAVDEKNSTSSDSYQSTGGVWKCTDLTNRDLLGFEWSINDNKYSFNHFALILY
jgi:hypothetical protein